MEQEERRGKRNGTRGTKVEWEKRRGSEIEQEERKGVEWNERSEGARETKGKVNNEIKDKIIGEKRNLHALINENKK